MNLLIISVLLFTSGYECSLLRSKRDYKSDLISTANLLISRANTEITELKQQNRTEEANLIASLETKIKSLVERLTAATNETEIKNIEQELGSAEGQLLSALGRVGQPLDAEELKSGLILYGDMLVERANEEIAKLRAENKTNAIELIDSEQKSIALLVAELKNATLLVDVFEFEQLLARAEISLQEELARLGVAWNAREARDILIDAANSLTNRTNVVIAKLRAEGRNETIADLEQELQRIANITKQLQNATDNAVIEALEFSLEQAEFRLDIQLTILGVQSISRQERQLFLREIEELASRVLIEARKLNAANRTLEAEGLFNEQQLLVELDVAVRSVVNVYDFFYFENRFRQIRTRILSLLSSLSSVF